MSREEGTVSAKARAQLDGATYGDGVGVGLPGGPSRRPGEGLASVWGFELSPRAAAGS